MTNQILERKIQNKNSGFAEKMSSACKKIAPVWSLENFVAVNPFLGFTDQKFENTAHYHSQVGGVQLTMPRAFYKNKIREGKITEEDIEIALSKSPLKCDVKEFFQNLKSRDSYENKPGSTATFADIATQVTQKNWNEFILSRISAWAASYFDNGQAGWVASYHKAGIFTAWKLESEIDLTPEINGLKNFRKRVKALPDHPIKAAKNALEKMDMVQEGLEDYLYRLLLRAGGWAGYIARLDWENKQTNDTENEKLMEFLSILICWEFCFYETLKSAEAKEKWQEVKKPVSTGILELKLIKTLQKNWFYRKPLTWR